MPLLHARRAFAAAFCFSPLSISAQTPVTQLDTVVVTASRSPQRIGDALGDITVIDRQTLQQAGGDSLASILSRQPGVQVTDSGGRQTPNGVMLRGANPSHTLVLMDGVRINSSIQGGVNWGALDPAAIERVEILRGAASSLYGSDAIGGVINIITRKGLEDRPVSAWADLGVGSHNTFKASTGFSGAADGWDYSLVAGMAESGGYGSTTPDVAFDNHHPDDDGYSQHTLSGSLGYRWANGQHLGMSFYNSYLDGDYDAGQWSHPAYALTRQQVYSVTSTNELTDQWQSVLRMGLSKESYDDRAWGTTFSTLQRLYSWQHNYQLTDDQRVSAYVERTEERPQHGAGLEVTQRNTNAVGAVYTGRLGRHQLQASVRNDNISAYGNEITGGLGYDFDLTETWTLGVAANTGFHAPTFSDLYYPGSEHPDLQPEKSRNIEAHLRYQKDGLKADATVYQNKVRNLLTWDNSTYRMENVDRATLRGLSLTAEYAWKATTVRASADFLQPRNDATGDTLLRRARHRYTFAVEQRLDALKLGAEYEFMGKREDTRVDPITFTSARITLGGYSLMNLTAAYEFSESTSVQLRWNNVFDKQYANTYGYNAEGSNVFLNLSLRM